MKAPLVMISLSLMWVGTAVAATSPPPYRNTDYGFQLQMPAGAWKKVPFPGGLVAFREPEPHCSVGIQVRKQDVHHFEGTVTTFHHLASTLPNLLQKARVYRGKTARGNPIAYIEVIEWNDADQPVVVAVSHTRLEKRGTTVVTTFQGVLTVHGRQLDRHEVNLEEAQAKSICMSVDSLPP